jgi:hypothetical protein
MHFLQGGFGDLLFGDAALIGDGDHAKAGTIQQRDTFGYAREDVEVFPPSDVLTLDRPLIDDSISIQENGAIHELTWLVLHD